MTSLWGFFLFGHPKSLKLHRTQRSGHSCLQARKAWGATLNRVRDTARQALTWMKDMEERDELLRYLVAMPYALKDHMLREDKLVEDLQVRAAEPGVCLLGPGCSLDCFSITWLIQMPAGADGPCLMSCLHILEMAVLRTWDESMRATIAETDTWW